MFLFPKGNIYSSSNETNEALNNSQFSKDEIEKSARLLELLRALDLSQRAFAIKLNVSTTSISQILSGKRRLTANLAWEIQRVFPKANVTWLMTGEGEMFKNGNPDEDPYDLPENAHPMSAEEIALRKEVAQLKDEIIRQAEDLARERKEKRDLMELLKEAMKNK